MSNLHTPEVIVLVLVGLLFGAGRLPEAARGAGRALRVFRAEASGLAGEHGREDRAAESGDAGSTERVRRQGRDDSTRAR
jgi:sec-independent protein translocase protein TatA